MNLLRTILTTFLLIVGLASNAFAQDKVAVLADQITYDQQTQVLTARGNVKVFYQDQTLRTEELRYNQKTGELVFPGPLTITQADGQVLTADAATLSDDLKRGLVSGARVLIDQQLQLAASELVTQDDRYTVLTQVVGSTCNICEERKIPFWQIRSKRVVHDKLERRLYFENATLRVSNIPVLYFPNLSIPEPGVTRATGFLVPEFSQSNRLGYGVEIPFYLAIDDHSDATITPSIFTEESFILGAEYRRRFRNGSIKFQGAVALADALSNRHFRSYVQGDGKFNLRNDFKLTFGLHLASDRSFKTDYDFGDEDRLTNFVTVDKTTKRSYTAYSASFTQSLRPNEIDQEIPVVLPEVYFRTLPSNNPFGGSLGLTAHSTALLRDDELWLRAGGGVDWNRTWTLPNGIRVKGELEAELNGYVTQNYTNYRTNTVIGNDNFMDATGHAAVDIRYPLMRKQTQVTHMIEPVVQLVWSPDRISTAPNEDAAQAEFEETNLFSLNRFPGFDRSEAGLFANIGINYLRYDPSGWELEATAGRVFRSKDLGQFPITVSSGLDGRKSDYVGALRLRFPNTFEFETRALFNSDLNVSKNETFLSAKNGKFAGFAKYVWLEQNVVLNSNQSEHSVNFGGSYKASEHWLYTADWRHNLDSGEPIEGNFGIQYQNECAKVNLSMSLEYDDQGNETREFGLKFALEGLGNRQQKKKLAHRCAL